MDKIAFVERLKGAYSSGYNNVMGEYIMNWIDEEGINDTQLDTLEYLIANEYTYKGFPNLPAIKEIYKNGYSYFAGKTEDIYYPTIFVNHVVKKQRMDLPKIIKTYFDIEKKKFKEDKELTCYEACFLAFFSELVGNYRDRKHAYSDRDNELKTENELENLKMGQEIEREIIDTRNKDFDAFGRKKGTKTSKELVSGIF